MKRLLKLEVMSLIILKSSLDVKRIPFISKKFVL